MKIILALLILVPFSNAYAHCQVPCGIYDDVRTFDELEEHIKTIEKSMTAINDSGNAHNIARWTINKEEHAQKIQDIMSAYFLTQRLKPNDHNYVTRLMTIHQISIAAMKAKQTTDLEYIDTLEMLVARHEKLFFAPHDDHKEKK